MKIFKNFNIFIQNYFFEKRNYIALKLIKESFQFKIKNSKICFWQQTSKINYVGRTLIFQIPVFEKHLKIFNSWFRSICVGWGSITYS